MSDPVASEKAAELAAAEKIDLAAVKGSGKDGLIKVEDVREAIAKRKAAEDAGGGSSSSSTSEAAGGGSEAKPSKSEVVMAERHHKDGCPLDPDRVEIYDQEVPPKRRSDGAVEHAARIAKMAHCCDCGNTVEIR